MVDLTEEAVSSWREGEVRDVHQEMMRLALRIAATTLLGSEVEDEAERVGAALEVLARRFSGPKSYLLPVPEALPTPANRRFRRAVAQLDDIVYGIIRWPRDLQRARGQTLEVVILSRSVLLAPS